MSKGILVVISGFSGAGKGTVINQLRKQYPGYGLSISATSRNKRESEEEGVNYFYKTREQFEEMIKQGSFIEYAEYCGNYYGTPKAYVQQQLEQGIDVILEIEVQGALKVKETFFPEALMLFITPPSAQELKRRLVGRGREDEAAIQRRMERAVEESRYMDQYEYIIINQTDMVKECAEEIHRLIQSMHGKPGNCPEFIQDMQRGLEAEVLESLKGE